MRTTNKFCAGFAMVEALVATAIFTLTFLAVVQISHIMATNQKKMRQNSTFTDLSNQVSTVLNDEHTCPVALAGIVMPALNASTPITTIKFNDVSAGTITIFDPSTKVENLTVSAVLTQKGLLGATVSGTGKMYFADLELVTNQGAQKQSRHINFIAETDASNVIQNCYERPSQLQNLCAMIDGTFTAETTTASATCVFSQTCPPQTALVGSFGAAPKAKLNCLQPPACPNAGDFLVGVTAAGAPICNSTRSAVLCPPGQFLTALGLVNGQPQCGVPPRINCVSLGYGACHAVSGICGKAVQTESYSPPPLVIAAGMPCPNPARTLPCPDITCCVDVPKMTDFTSYCKSKFGAGPVKCSYTLTCPDQCVPTGPTMTSSKGELTGCTSNAGPHSFTESCTYTNKSGVPSNQLSIECKDP